MPVLTSYWDPFQILGPINETSRIQTGNRSRRKCRDFQKFEKHLRRSQKAEGFLVDFHQLSKSPDTKNLLRVICLQSTPIIWLKKRQGRKLLPRHPLRDPQPADGMVALQKVQAARLQLLPRPLQNPPEELIHHAKSGPIWLLTTRRKDRRTTSAFNRRRHHRRLLGRQPPAGS